MERHPWGIGGQAEPFGCAVEPLTDGMVVRPYGELDCWTVGSVEQQLLDIRDAGVGNIELDLGSTSFMDSSGIALVVRWSRESAASGFMLRVRAGTHAVRRLFEMTAITHLLVDAAEPEPLV